MLTSFIPSPQVRLRNIIESNASTGREAFRIADGLVDGIIATLRRAHFRTTPILELELLFADWRRNTEMLLFHRLRDRIHVDDISAFGDVR